MQKEFEQITWSEAVAADCRRLMDLAAREDVLDRGDLTTLSLVPDGAQGRAAAVARKDGVAAGIAAVPTILACVDETLAWKPECEDGARLTPGTRLGVIEGPASSLLVAERLVLNVLGRLSGIATLTDAYVQRVLGTDAKIYDTRKTTPGWRLLEKYAVQCGGGVNHRPGLYAAVMIKDNHLAFGARDAAADVRYTPAEAVKQARAYVDGLAPEEGIIVEVEVDTLEQLDEVMPARPDIVLLDNMPPKVLAEAVRRRNATGLDMELEASGGVNLQTVHAIAESGVERISVGALTHSAVALDIGLDWDV